MARRVRGVALFTWPVWALAHWQSTHELAGPALSSRVLLLVQGNKDTPLVLSAASPAPSFSLIARLYFSLYGPRLKRSAQIVLVWTAVFLGVVLITYYLTSHHGEVPVRLTDGPAAGDGKMRSPQMEMVE